MLRVFKNLILFFCLSHIFFGCSYEPTSNLNYQREACIQLDSLITEAEGRKISSDESSDLLKQAYEVSKALPNDSLRIKYLFRISSNLFSNKAYKAFKEVNNDFYNVSKENVDSMSIADYYWNLGFYFLTLEKLDSSFYHYEKARKIFNSVKHNYYAAKMEYNIALLLRRSKHYKQSENYAFRSINNLKNLDRKELLYKCYNHLGLVYNDMRKFDLSIQYHLKAFDLIDDLSDKYVYRERSLNNLALLYQKQDLYEKAIQTFDKALENKSLKSRNANLYAKLIDNRAYSRFLLGDTTNVLNDFKIALYLRDSLANKAGIGLSKMRLAEYYLAQADSVKSFSYSREAYNLAVEYGLNREILSGLILMSRTNPKDATLYMKEYVTLNDSLLAEERMVQDKFSRIEFETDEYIAANEDLKKQNIWISVSSALGLASLSLLFFVYRQRSLNKTLELERLQQDANQEIYDSMLKQQGREEVARIHERVRISEELHDGALARLFSVRIGLGFLKVQGNKDEGERYQNFMRELQKVEKEIRSLSHALKNDDLSSKKDFPKLISELLEEQSVIGKFSFDFKQDEGIAWNLVDEKIKINLFRILQESIFNSIKYASCDHVNVELVKKKSRVELIIVDDGQGFDTNKKNRGIGLKNMRSRGKNIKAMVKVRSEIGKGTKIKVQIPTKTLYHEADT